MLTSSSVILIGLTCLLGLATGEVCLHRPYITGLRILGPFNVIYNVTTSMMDYVNVAFELELDYTTILTVVTSFQYAAKDLGSMNFSIKVKDDIYINNFGVRNEIVYAESDDPGLRQTKKKYREGLNQFYVEKRLASRTSPAHNMIELCRVSIFNTMIRINYPNTELSHIAYLDISRCYWKRSKWESVFLKANEIRSKNIVSAAFEYPLLFEITADGGIYIKENHPTHINTLIGDHLFRSKICKREIERINIRDPSAIEDYNRPKPFRSITQLNHDEYLTVLPQSNPDEMDLRLWIKIKSSGAYEMTSLYYGFFNNPLLKYWSLEAISSLPDPNNSHAHLIFFNRGDNSVGYIQNVNLANPDSLNIRWIYKPPLAPDDIAHWTTCERIISVYGFLYTMHKYDEHIFIDASRWFIFDEDWFDFKIEAMHATGDEFMFFTKATTVILMKANPKNCDKLELSNKRVMHLRQLFNFSPKQFYTEGRYFDGKQWVPPLEWVPPIYHETSLSWLYILIGVVCTIGVLLIMLVIVLRRSQREQTVIFSRSRSSFTEGPLYKSPRPIRNEVTNQPESSLPLFSQHQSVPPPQRKKSLSPRKYARKTSPKSRN